MSDYPPPPDRAPVKVAEEYIDLNGRIAAALTRWVGSMWIVYATLAIVGVWMAMGMWGPLRSIDPYPFPFMLFVGNLVQLLLCFVILVGQKVLRRAADKRAKQTYENAEAIFQEVLSLDAHLVRQDRMLSQGISLLDWRPHPWIEQHGVQEPPRAKDYAASINGRIAAWLTERVGSMWAFYSAAFLQFSWIVLAQAHVLGFDPYPYAFLLFLSSLAQLIFMFVIMVGQDVLGKAADTRSEQTFLNAEAILHECRRMEAHLAARDQIINSLCGYFQANVTEQLARALHSSYLEARIAQGEAPASRAALLPWEDLPEDLKESNRDHARHTADKLAAIRCIVLPRFDPAHHFEFQSEEVQMLARMEHDRWVEELRARGFVHGPTRDDRHHPDLVAWENLPDEAREKDVRFIRDLPGVLGHAGFQILRLSPRTSEHANRDTRPAHAN